MRCSGQRRNAAPFLGSWLRFYFRVDGARGLSEYVEVVEKPFGTLGM
jgi:hypothetical protein